MKPNNSYLSNKRILVTGGTGFIGGRLVEKLVLEHKAKVRVLVRDFARSSRIARFPIEMVHGNITEPCSVEQAVIGCELVFHCAYGNQGSKEEQHLVNVEGTKNVMESALIAKVKRVVHLSTLMVYGFTPPKGILDETAPHLYSGDVYSDSKLDAEKIALGYAKEQALPVVILQPTAVYGPWGPVWPVNVLEQLKRGRVILVDGGSGLCNAVYVDDVVSAMLLAAVKEDGVGESFLISSEHPVTWQEFYGRFSHMLDISGTVSMSATEANSYYKKQQKVKHLFSEIFNILREDTSVRQRLAQTYELATLRKIARSLLPDKLHQLLKKQLSSNNKTALLQIANKDVKPIIPLPPKMINFYQPKTRVCIEKAKNILGYQPAFDLEKGTRLTEQWASWANLLGK